jgi:protein-tyrosine phosphatase
MSRSPESDPAPMRVLMVCMGNICRSPTAQGVLEHLVAQQGWQPVIQIDSAGTHDYHIGLPPDTRSQQHARARGYDLSGQRARQLLRSDFSGFDWVLVMDADNERAARTLCPAEHQHKIRLLASFCQTQQMHEVPDPYYGGAEGFETVLDLCEDACQGFLAFWLAHRGR